MAVDVWLESIVCEAAASCGLENFQPEIRPSNPRFGDFQANGVLQCARERGENARILADRLVTILSKRSDVAAAVNISVAGPGFINFRFSDKFLCDWLNGHAHADSFSHGLDSMAGEIIVVDYSSPNTAKQMHVGHLRSLNIGESICRLLEFCGASVIRDNHIGDWGTQFGVLIMAIKHSGVKLDDLPAGEALVEIERLYKLGNAMAKADATRMADARNELVKLQMGDVENRAIWEKINELSLSSFGEIYSSFGVKFDYTLGESFYSDKVDGVCESLERCGLAKSDAGALVVFLKDDERFKDQPFLIRKSDGASNYATTDLATVEYRISHFHADEIIYVTDGRQQDHFQQLFLTVSKWFGAIGLPLPEVHHVWFGTILGDDGKAIRTRDGSPIHLGNLIAEAKNRAYGIVSEKNASLDESEKRSIASVVGLGAIRYFDLAQNRTSDYVFSWDSMLSFEGNTAVYLLYAIARMHSILDKVSGEECTICDIETEEERALARKLLCFPVILKQAISDLRPHHLCTYLYELASEYSCFYGKNRVLVDDISTRGRRLVLCRRTLLVLELGLKLLGLETLKRM